MKIFLQGQLTTKKIFTGTKASLQKTLIRDLNQKRLRTTDLAVLDLFKSLGTCPYFE